MVNRRLRKLEETKECCLNKLQELQRPVLESLQSEVFATVSEFVPDVKGIQFDANERIRRFARKSSIYVNDGTDTDLEAKGDGVKSLLAIALMRHASQADGEEKNLILCIEDPESHLHPKAVLGLRRVLMETTNTNQLVVSTHSPVLVDRINVSGNIIASGGKATRCDDYGANSRIARSANGR